MHRRRKGRGELKDYIPLMVLVVLTLLAACAKYVAYFSSAGYDYVLTATMQRAAGEYERITIRR